MSRLTEEQLEPRMPAAHLPDRGVVRVSGPDAKTFLDNLLTCDLDRVSPAAPRLGALLTPQGKILFDFIVFEAPAEMEGGYFLDVALGYAADLAKRLSFYRLRAKVTVEDRSDGLAVVAGWGGTAAPANEFGLVAMDPRLADLGWRAIVAAQDVGELDTVDPQAYHAHRIALGVPEGGRDFVFGDAFPHEALMDQLHGVDFDKGCYVGQEVVSRMHHRGTARTRIVPARYLDGFAAEAGSEVTAGERTLGRAGTGAGDRGLVMIRLDRAEEAVQSGEPLRSGGLAIRLERPDWVGFPVPVHGDAPAAGA
jgi:folate-binding protein YgfZ